MRKVNDHIPSGFPMSTRSSFKGIENQHDVFRGKYCMKSFCESNWFQINLSTNEQQESYENAKVCYIYKETFQDKYAKDKKHRKVRKHCDYKLNIEVLHIIYVIWNLVYLKKLA